MQTLVENAIKHGLEKRRNGGALRLICQPTPEGLAEIVVADTGIGIPALFGQGDAPTSNAAFFGIGLRNVAARLEMLYGRNDLLRMMSDPETGTTVRLLLPLTTHLQDREEPFDFKSEIRMSKSEINRNI